MANKVEYYKDWENEWRWRVIADNGNIIADSSEGYKNKGDCMDAYISMQTGTR